MKQLYEFITVISGVLCVCLIACWTVEQLLEEVFLGLEETS